MARVPPFMQIWPAPLVNGHSGSGSPGMWKLCILGASVDHLLLVSQHFSSEVWPCKGVEVFVDRWPDSNRASERVAPLWCDIQMSKVNRFSPMWVNLAWSQQMYISIKNNSPPRHQLCCKLHSAPSPLAAFSNCEPPPPPSCPLTSRNNKTRINWCAKENRLKWCCLALT